MGKQQDKFDLVATRNALSMLPGRERTLPGMWRKLLPHALKLLSCRAGYIWLHDALSEAGGYARSYSYPSLAFVSLHPASDLGHAIKERQSDAARRTGESLIEEDGLFHHLLPLGQSGFIVLQRTSPMPQPLRQILKLILASLADARQVWLQPELSGRGRLDNKCARIVFESIGDAVIVTDMCGRIELINPVAQGILGCSQAEAQGKTLSAVFQICDEQTGEVVANPVELVLRDGKTAGRKNHTLRLTHDRREVPIEDSAMPVNDARGNISGVVLVFHDVTEKKRARQQIEYQARYDELTGLPNRRLFLERLEQAIQESRRTGLPLALLFLDIDLFREVNNTLGHNIGDLLLKEAAQRLKSCVSETDTVARLSGDEFAVILPELGDLSVIERISGNICTALVEPFLLGEEQVFISASIGITLYPNDADTVEELFKHAEQAVHAAKVSGRNRCSYFIPALQEAAEKRMRLIGDLRGALEKQQFMVYYQPIIELATGSIHKAEALIRWQHPKRGMVSPAEFIGIAEETGLINDIGNWVFQQAAQLAKHLQTSYHPSFQISVNKSPVQFHSAKDDFGAWLDYLQQLGLQGNSIAVEITEGLLLDIGSGVTEKLLAMRDAGMQVSLDDFGTGYSSLSYLKKYDIDYLKIDQSFVRDMTYDKDDQALCAAIIVMAHTLGLKVIAEGVETILQRDLLRSMNCDYAQGYLFSRPAPANEFEKLLAQS